MKFFDNFDKAVIHIILTIFYLAAVLMIVLGLANQGLALFSEPIFWWVIVVIALANIGMHYMLGHIFKK